MKKDYVTAFEKSGKGMRKSRRIERMHEKSAWRVECDRAVMRCHMFSVDRRGEAR